MYVVATDSGGGAVRGGVCEVEVGVERDRRWSKLRHIDVPVGGYDGTGSIHVRHRTVQSGPRLVRRGPSQNLHSSQRLRLSW